MLEVVDSCCVQCGRALDQHDRQVRFRLPDPVLSAFGGALPDDAWLDAPDPSVAVMMQVPRLGAFVRVLAPIPLSGGFSVTFGAWLGVHPDDLQRAFRVWHAPAYADLDLDGRLANDLLDRGVLGAPARATVLNVLHTPYVTTSTDERLVELLRGPSDHDDVLSHLPA
ncbi:DUF2199 domain-containing protein [Actinotalea sp. M2MS4P-6]|uniref:DUF2199 domain-containing protein n=1 Tax=Actinotalea sp. M2MS4P-6 TaxID=2983762 RepID=UPI0021E37844|nr:DUF2199 domain-containing protein [Actinotalea sp. M2MS4P-6]MCV2393134.1 DUF2199 domain-containing protein [Actinotalea sp. M2MS4P-6]